MIPTTCSVCGRQYEAITQAEADNPNRHCLACHFDGFPYWIENIYPASNITVDAFLMYKPLDGRTICVGGTDTLPDGRTVAEINMPPCEDGDIRILGEYNTRNEALAVLWAFRSDAFVG